jgi:glucose-6-phosphate 1-dehydrogenase
MLIGVETTLYSQDQVWKNVPFVLRAAKNAAESTVRVQVYFRGDLCERVSFELQPTERATITLFAQTTDTPEEVSFVVTFPEQRFPDAYERLLADIVSWEKRFAMPFDVVREGWRIVDPLLNPSLTSSHE